MSTRYKRYWFCGNSYFCISWDWVKTALWQSWQLIVSVCFSSNRNPEPVIASRRQHELRS